MKTTMMSAGRMRRAARTLGSMALLFGTAGAGSAAARPLAIEPMTTLGANGSGYFQDPYPVRLAPSRAGRTVVFSGTTKAIMSCNAPVSAGCFSWTPARIDQGTLGPAIAAAGAMFTNFQNLDVFQADDGGWHAVLAIGVKRPGQPPGDYWTVLVHAHPTTNGSPDAVPLSWSADTVLSGSFSERADGNYDGKYVEDNGKLYLLYVRNLVPRPALRNGIVIRPMLSPTRLASAEPVTLLTPGDRFGPLTSEWYDHTPSKLVEAPFIARIGGKYALIYSTGAFQHVDYKAGVAWSDTLLPAPGSRYRKVLRMDAGGVWGQAGRPEVQYLVQSEVPAWPNYTPGQVFGPGVASALQGPGGAWSLYFAGYDFADRPTGSSAANAAHRRPYFVRLRAAVPPGRPVGTASDAELATWLEPARQ